MSGWSTLNFINVEVTYCTVFCYYVIANIVIFVIFIAVSLQLVFVFFLDK